MLISGVKNGKLFSLISVFFFFFSLLFIAYFFFNHFFLSLFPFQLLLLLSVPPLSPSSIVFSTLFIFVIVYFTQLSPSTLLSHKLEQHLDNIILFMFLSLLLVVLLAGKKKKKTSITAAIVKFNSNKQ